LFLARPGPRRRRVLHGAGDLGVSPESSSSVVNDPSSTIRLGRLTYFAAALYAHLGARRAPPRRNWPSGQLLDRPTS